MSTTDLWLTFSSLKLVCLQVKKSVHKHFIGILFDVQAEKKVQASEEATTALAKFGEKPLGISIGGFTCINGSCWGWRIVKFHGFSNEQTFPAQFWGIFLQFWTASGAGVCRYHRNYFRKFYPWNGMFGFINPFILIKQCLAFWNLALLLMIRKSFPIWPGKSRLL